MTPEIPVPRTRRALLAAGLAAGAATVASAITRPLAVEAANNDAVLVGNSYTASAATTIGNTTTAAPTLVANNVTGVALVGSSDSERGVEGVSNSASGVQGTSTTGYGVEGVSTATTGWHAGVFGSSAADDGNGVWGENDAVTGYTGGVSGQIASPNGAATWGYAPGNGTGAMGVSGADPGTAPSNVGVYGLATQASGAIGVQGNAPAGVGVLATTTTGIALQVAGKAKFSRAGRASVLKNKTFVDITVAGGLAANSVVSATLQTFRAGVAIAAVRTNYPVAGKARIYLTKVASTTAATSVGWFVAEY